MKEWIYPILVALILAILANKFIVFNAYIPSESMSPTLKKGDRLLVNRIYNIQRGDIVVFDSNELDELLIKRVIGLPGDKIIIKNGEVIVNEVKIDEKYVKNNNYSYEGEFFVPENKYFFLGDNRSNSNDSRFWINPYIEDENIVGKAGIKVYPFNKFGLLK